MKVKLLGKWRGNPVNTILEVNESVGDGLIANKLAVAVMPVVIKETIVDRLTPKKMKHSKK